MTLFKRGVVWWTNFYQDGIRHQESTGTQNKRIAERIERKLKDEAALRKHAITLYDPHLTFQQLSTKFNKAGHEKFFHTDRLKHVLPFFGELRIHEITKGKVTDYRTKRQADDGPLTEATLNRDVAVLRRILYWALEENLILANPIARIAMGRERRTKKPVVSITDEQKILAVAKPHLKEIMIAGIDTGMRRGELLSQRWEDVDLERKVLFVTRSKTPEGEMRELPMTGRLYEILKSRSQASGPVFTFNKKPMLDLKTSWGTAQEDAKLTHHYRFHDLRHTFATRLMEAGVMADVRMALMGHEPRSVHWGYTHVDLKAKKAAIRKLESWMKKEQKRK